MQNELNSDNYPKTFQDAITFARNYEDATGQRLATVPNPDKEIYFDLENRTVRRLGWDKRRNIIEIITSGDDGREVSRRIVLSRKQIDEMEKLKEETGG